MKDVGDQWQIIEYEIKMFYGTHKKLFTKSTYVSLPYVLKNALEESAVLHTRILCEVFLGLSGKPDDVTLGNLLPGWPSDDRYDSMKEIQGKLKIRYGEPNNQSYLVGRSTKGWHILPPIEAANMTIETLWTPSIL